MIIMNSFGDHLQDVNATKDYNITDNVKKSQTLKKKCVNTGTVANMYYILTYIFVDISITNNYVCYRVMLK